jgi:hypothetical protein
MTRLACALALPGLIGCDGSAVPGVMVTDSAGVRITLTSGTPRIHATVDPQPLLSLGGAEATGPAQFYQIMGVHVDARERLWVADGQSGELRLFGPDGSHWKTRGGRGEGPGEFLRMRLLGSFRGDTVAVADDANGRVTVFDPEGEAARTVRLPSVDEVIPLGRRVFEDGTVLAQVPRILRASSLEADQILGDTVRLVRVDLVEATSRHELLGAGPLWLWTGRSQVPIPFTINAAYAVSGASVHFASGATFRVRVFEGGRLSEMYGVARDAQAMTGMHLEAYRAYLDEYVPEALRVDYLAALDHPARPAVLPAYDLLVVAGEGTAWAQLYSPDPAGVRTWDVFGPDREWLGEVETPAGFTIMHVTDDKLTGVWRDELGVEHVRTYRYDRVRAPG